MIHDTKASAAVIIIIIIIIISLFKQIYFTLCVRVCVCEYMYGRAEEGAGSSKSGFTLERWDLNSKSFLNVAGTLATEPSLLHHPLTRIEIGFHLVQASPKLSLL